MPPRYKPRDENDPKDPYKLTALPVEKPVAVYYRQSSEAQIGNISTTLQTVDMVEHLVHLGWTPESVIMIDMDAGISGSKLIQDRPGMSELMRLIEARTIGAVAAQDVDRFFRDVTQIQTNIFIETCRQNNVLVLTPTMVFDFNHPMQGRYHIQMFRDQAQRAADYLEYQIKGRLVKARFWRSERGMWAGRKVAPGFMVDDRTHLPNGERNLNYRKYVRFPMFAEIVLTYFKLFQEYNGAMSKVVAHIHEQGPFYPENSEALTPEGFIFKPMFTHRSKITGQLCPGSQGLYYLLTNVVYIGHWTFREAVVIWDNHEAIIPLDLFMYAFNRLSKTNFHGEPNPEYAPYKLMRRQPKSERHVPPPIYTGLIFSDEVPDMPHRLVNTVWRIGQQCYDYKLSAKISRHMVWSIKADYVDRVIDEMLLERLQATTLDEQLWQDAIQATRGDGEDIHLLESEIRREKSEQDNLIASLRTLSHPAMVRRAQAQYEASERRVADLETQIESIRASQKADRHMLQARPALQRIATNWENIPRNERRNLFQAFAREIHLNRTTYPLKQVTVLWKDGTTSSRILRKANYRGHFWSPEDIELLCELFNRHAPQAEIMQAFPEYKWRVLRNRYKYHVGEDAQNYTRDELPYSATTRWMDTEAYRSHAQWAVNDDCTTEPEPPAGAGCTTVHRP